MPFIYSVAFRFKGLHTPSYACLNSWILFSKKNLNWQGTHAKYFLNNLSSPEPKAHNVEMDLVETH